MKQTKNTSVIYRRQRQSFFRSRNSAIALASTVVFTTVGITIAASSLMSRSKWHTASIKWMAKQGAAAIADAETAAGKIDMQKQVAAWSINPSAIVAPVSAHGSFTWDRPNNCSSSDEGSPNNTNPVLQGRELFAVSGGCFTITNPIDNPYQSSFFINSTSSRPLIQAKGTLGPYENTHAVRSFLPSKLSGINSGEGLNILKAGANVQQVSRVVVQSFPSSIFTLASLKGNPLWVEDLRKFLNGSSFGRLYSANRVILQESHEVTAPSVFCKGFDAPDDTAVFKKNGVSLTLNGSQSEPPDVLAVKNWRRIGADRFMAIEGEGSGMLFNKLGGGVPGEVGSFDALMNECRNMTLQISVVVDSTTPTPTVVVTPPWAVDWFAGMSPSTETPEIPGSVQDKEGSSFQGYTSALGGVVVFTGPTESSNNPRGIAVNIDFISSEGGTIVVNPSPETRSSQLLVSSPQKIALQGNIVFPESHPAMFVAPEIWCEPGTPLVSSTTITWENVGIVTTGPDLAESIKKNNDPDNFLTLSFKGSLVMWEKIGEPTPLETFSPWISVHPADRMVSGEIMPWAAPSLSDVRAGSMTRVFSPVAPES